MLIDVVNFNADASCFSSEDWLGALEGGSGSTLYRWLSLYVEKTARVSIGFTGATLADMHAFNPESIRLLRENPNVFEILWRPFSHDIAFFRSDKGFRTNVELGRRAAEKLIGRVSPCYLPPEFMQTNRQTALLAELGARATMIMDKRFSSEVASTIPVEPFLLGGIPNGLLPCIPLNGTLTDAYLKTIQRLDPSFWQESARENADHLVLWRDGESAFLLPDTVDREATFLDSVDTPRVHLDLDSLPGKGDPRSYPVHPFSAWMNEMRMMWFLLRLRELESRTMSPEADEQDIARWLGCIGSDIFSAVEKASPVVSINDLDGTGPHDLMLPRCQRGFEGERLLERAERQDSLTTPNDACMRKAAARDAVVLELL